MEPTGEMWRPHPTLRGIEVSTHGRIKGARGWIRNPQPNGFGYLKVNIESRTYKVQRLVADAWMGERPIIDGRPADIAHLNGDRSDNRLANLRWCSRRENMGHMRYHGTRPCPVVVHVRERMDRLGERETPEQRDARLREMSKRLKGVPRPDLKGMLAGSRNPSARLTESQVWDVLVRHKRGETCGSIAKSLGISDMQVSRITRGIKWAHVHREFCLAHA